MIDGPLWKPIHKKALWREDGSVQYVILERHRITGRTRLAEPLFENVYTPADGGRS